jgi:hypothetical protein
MDRTAGLQSQACQKYERKERLHRQNGPRNVRRHPFPGAGSVTPA